MIATLERVFEHALPVCQPIRCNEWNKLSSSSVIWLKSLSRAGSVSTKIRGFLSEMLGLFVFLFCFFFYVADYVTAFCDRVPYHRIYVAGSVICALHYLSTRARNKDEPMSFGD